MSLDLTKCKVKTVTISATAGNVATNLTPTIGKRWIVLRAQILLTTDATVADRYVHLSYFNVGGIEYYRLLESAKVVASKLHYLVLGLFQTGTGVGAYGGDIRDYFNIGFPFIVKNNDYLKYAVASGVAGDSYAGYVEVLEV